MSIPQSGGGPIEDHAQLAAYLEDGCKPKEDWRIGTEHEKFGYLKDGHAPLPFEGEKSIVAVREGLRARHGWAEGRLSCRARPWRRSTRPATR
jgi:glutamate--cysteine ligase